MRLKLISCQVLTAEVSLVMPASPHTKPNHPKPPEPTQQVST
jgi:hypothetical protein